MTQREFNKEVRAQFEMMWGVLAPSGVRSPYTAYWCDKRIGGKRRRIFKSHVNWAPSNITQGDFQLLVRKIWQIIANQTGDWKVVEGFGFRGQLDYIGLANWR